MNALTLALALTLGIGGPARERLSPKLGTTATPADAGTPDAGTPSAPVELTDQELADRVETYLSTIHDPIGAEQWKALGPRAVPLLQAIAEDRSAFPSRRARALGALAAIGDQRGRATVLKAARSEEESFAVRAAAIRSAGHLVPAAELKKEIGPVLENARRASVRATAAEVLTQRAPAEGCEAVRTRMKAEKEPLRRHFDRALRRCDNK